MKPHIWFDDGNWWVGYGRDALISWGAQTICEAWNNRIDWLTRGESQVVRI